MWSFSVWRNVNEINVTFYHGGKRSHLFHRIYSPLKKWFTVFCVPFLIIILVPATLLIIPQWRKSTVPKILLYSVSLHCVKKAGCRKWSNEQRKANIAAICIFLSCHQKNNISTLPTKNRKPLLRRKNLILLLLTKHISVIQNDWKMSKKRIDYDYFKEHMPDQLYMVNFLCQCISELKDTSFPEDRKLLKKASSLEIIGFFTAYSWSELF